LELFIEPNDATILSAADNLIVCAWGDIITCEDREDDAKLVGITPQGALYPIAQNHLRTEFTGVTFSPDGSTLFVNLQKRGMTVAITGPWNQRVTS
jgi:secreted PhoX family phosphatase